MSHLTKIETKISDIDALRKACHEAGFTFSEEKAFYWYRGTNPCDYRIDVPGVNYQIGVIQTQEGDYALLYDNWNPVQRKYTQELPTAANKVRQLYVVHVATKQAQKRGMRVQRKVEKDGTITLTITGARL
jgi:hypothetical protein